MIQGIIFQICIIKVVLDITEHNTVDWRRQNNISDSDGIQSGWTRIRCDTVSTAHSDSHDRKRKRLEENIFYHNSLCSRVQEISWNFSDLTFFAVATVGIDPCLVEKYLKNSKTLFNQ